MAQCEVEEDNELTEYPTFSAKVVEREEKGWGGVTVAVLQHNYKDHVLELGRYKRNYSTNFNNFAWTRKGDQYFALYSPHYTCTRVMRLDPGKGFEDIGGEEKDGDGFCPTDLYIPTVQEYVSEEFHTHPADKIKDWSKLLDYYPSGSRTVGMSKHKGRQQLQYPDGRRVQAYDNPEKPDSFNWIWGPEKEMESGFVVLPPQHAFVAGCYWGDDSSWKIQYMDVSRIDEGIIKRDERFGYIELPPGLTLKQAIQFDDITEANGRFKMAVDIEFDITTGTPIIWDKKLADKIELGRRFVANRESEHRAWDLSSFNDEMKKRWAEQGARITAEIKAAGGKIG